MPEDFILAEGALEVLVEEGGSITPTTEGACFSLFQNEDSQPDESRAIVEAVQEKLRVLQELNSQNPISSIVKILLIQELERTLLVIEQIPHACFLKIYQEDLNKSKDLTPEKPFVARYGINAKALSSLVGISISHEKLNIIEKKLFEHALGKLNFQNHVEELAENGGSASSSAQKLSNNVVLVDIFVGRDEGMIKRTPENIPEINTIILWAREGQVMIMNPSAKKNSEFLVDRLGELCSEYSYEVFDPGEKVFYGAGNHQTGFSEEDELFRDCTDIAVKIAFVIQENQDASFQDIKNEIKKLSNKPNIYEVFKNVDNSFIGRDLQSSNYETREKAQQLMETFSQKVEPQLFQLTPKKNFTNLEKVELGLKILEYKSTFNNS